MASEFAECSVLCHVARAAQYTRASRKRELRLSSHSSGGVCDTRSVARATIRFPRVLQLLLHLYYTSSGTRSLAWFNRVSFVAHPAGQLSPIASHGCIDDKSCRDPAIVEICPAPVNPHFPHLRKFISSLWKRTAFLYIYIYICLHLFIFTYISVEKNKRAPAQILYKDIKIYNFTLNLYIRGIHIILISEQCVLVQTIRSVAFQDEMVLALGREVAIFTFLKYSFSSFTFYDEKYFRVRARLPSGRCFYAEKKDEIVLFIKD